MLQFSGQKRVLFDAPLIQEDPPPSGGGRPLKVGPLVVYNLFPSGSEEAAPALISALLAHPLQSHLIHFELFRFGDFCADNFFVKQG